MHRLPTRRRSARRPAHPCIVRIFHEENESKWRAAMASGIVVRPLDPWSCFSCRRFVSRSPESLTNNTIPSRWTTQEKREAHRRCQCFETEGQVHRRSTDANKDGRLFFHPERRD